MYFLMLVLILRVGSRVLELKVLTALFTETRCGIGCLLLSRIVFVNRKLNNASLAFGRTSAGSVWCFFGGFVTLSAHLLYVYRKIGMLRTETYI